MIANQSNFVHKYLGATPSAKYLTFLKWVKVCFEITDLLTMTTLSQWWQLLLVVITFSLSLQSFPSSTSLFVVYLGLHLFWLSLWFWKLWINLLILFCWKLFVCLWTLLLKMLLVIGRSIDWLVDQHLLGSCIIKILKSFNILDLCTLLMNKSLLIFHTWINSNCDTILVPWSCIPAGRITSMWPLYNHQAGRAGAILVLLVLGMMCII